MNCNILFYSLSPQHHELQIILFIAEWAKVIYFVIIHLIKMFSHANVIRKDYSKLYCEKQNRLELRYNNEIRERQNKR